MMYRDEEDGASEDQEALREQIRTDTAAALEAAMSWNDARDYERQDLVDRYLGEPYGNEQEGLSAVVDRTCFQTVGWILPGLLEIFHGSDETGAFDPTAEDEVAAAEQATDLVNHIYQRENQGFLKSHTVLQDALTERLGVWMVESEERVTVAERRLAGVPELEALALLQDEGVEILEAMPRQESAGAMARLYPDVQPEIVLDLRVRRTQRQSRVRVEAIPPEEYGYEPGARSAEASNLHYHVRTVPRSDLIALGYDPEIVEGLNADTATAEPERRRQHEDDWIMPEPHDSMAPIRVARVWRRADYDGDGVAEWRSVCLAGSGWTLLHEEVVDEPPFIPVSGVLLSHRVEGLSITDLVRDLQGIRTDMLRQMVDGMFEANTPTSMVRRSAGRDTWDAVLNPMPGRPIPVSAPDDVTFVQRVWTGAQALPFFEFLEREGEKRTGVSATSTGTSPDLLSNQTASGLNQLMSAAQQKVGLIARVFAECGFKPLFEKILREVVANQNRPRTVRIRGKWVQMDPASWNAQMDFTPNVGLGTGDKGKIREALGALLQVQRESMGAGLTLAGEKQVYNVLKELTRASGLPTVEPYFLDPDSDEAKAMAASRQQADPGQDSQVLAVTRAEEIRAAAMLEKARMEDDRERDALALKTWTEAAKAGVPFDLAALLNLMRQPRDNAGNPMPMAPDSMMTGGVQ